jgi:uncharacterized membrane protein
MRAAPGCLALLFFFAVVLLFPFFLANAMLDALGRLGLTPGLSVAAAMGMFLGGTLDIPVRRIPREEILEHPGAVFLGVGRFIGRTVRRTSYIVLAVNVGGCLIPCALAAYEIYLLAQAGWVPLAMTGLAVVVNTAVCWKAARPIQGLGIALPALLPGLVAAACALLLLPGMAPPTAFVAGVLGPLIGADLLHMNELEKLSAGVASIGGAGTFDGIVLSGLVATLLA